MKLSTCRFNNWVSFFGGGHTVWFNLCQFKRFVFEILLYSLYCKSGLCFHLVFCLWWRHTEAVNNHVPDLGSWVIPDTWKSQISCRVISRCNKNSWQIIKVANKTNITSANRLGINHVPQPHNTYQHWNKINTVIWAAQSRYKYSLVNIRFRISKIYIRKWI